MIIAIIMLLLSFEYPAQNIALNKKYTLDQLPNYYLTGNSSPLTSLTDGVFTNGNFWTDKSAIGWQNVNNITITIDLEKNFYVGDILFNTARGAYANVYYPEHIFVFLSDDNQSFNYAGDIGADKKNISGAYQVTKFRLNNINCSARFVTLKIITKGLYAFCDEIIVLNGKSNNRGIGIAPKISNNQVETLVAFLRNIKNYRKNALTDLNRIYKSENKNSIFSFKDYNDLKACINDERLNPKELEYTLAKIGEFNAKILHQKYRTSFLFEQCNTAANIYPLYAPKKPQEKLHYNFTSANNKVQYGGFVLTNLSNKVQNFTFNTSVSKNGESLLSLYKVEYIEEKDGRKVPDPLIPITKTTTVPAGVSQLFIFKVSSKELNYKTIDLSIAGDSKNVKLNIKIKNKKLPLNDNLNAVNWAYLNSPMIEGQKASAVTDLAQHHINTIVVPSHYVPLPGDENFETLITYLKKIKKPDKILLFANYSSPNNQHLNKSINYLTPDWKATFINWYTSLLNHLAAIGIDSASVYLYPYDEVEAKDVSNFKDFSVWGRANVKGLKIFATFSNYDVFEYMSSSVDIAQILFKMNYKIKIKRNLPDIWIYKTENNARALSPYTYYRLMAWQAYYGGYKGIGFWNYSDIGSNLKYNFISENRLDWRADYAIIYNGNHKEILSSRRWEAFKLGIEDYQLLKLYEKKYGVTATKEKVKKVVENVNNIDLADNIRNEIINKL
jgi:hypothetical protein